MANAWTSFVTNHYKKMKKVNPSYEFKHALKDAGKLYNKTVSKPVGVMRKSVGNMVMRKNKLRKTRKARRSRRNRK
jgi:hypothetical protein